MTLTAFHETVRLPFQAGAAGSEINGADVINASCIWELCPAVVAVLAVPRLLTGAAVDVEGGFLCHLGRLGSLLSRLTFLTAAWVAWVGLYEV